MKVSPLDVIKEWQSILPIIKSTPFNDVTLNEIYTLISSEYEGNIYVDSNNLATIALLILMVKHFSFCRRKIILKKPLETIETLKQYELHQSIEVTNTPNEYLYLICFTLNPFVGSILFVSATSVKSSVAKRCNNVDLPQAPDPNNKYDFSIGTISFSSLFLLLLHNMHLQQTI